MPPEIGAGRRTRGQGSASKDQRKRRSPGRIRHPQQEAEFVPVQTGITGTTDIEVLRRIESRVTKSSPAATKCCDIAAGDQRKVDNTAPKKEDENSRNLSVGLIRPTESRSRGLRNRTEDSESESSNKSS